MIDLYYRPGADSLPVHAALEEASAEYNLIRATRENGVFGLPEAARLNPADRTRSRPAQSRAWTATGPRSTTTWHQVTPTYSGNGFRAPTCSCSCSPGGPETQSPLVGRARPRRALLEGQGPPRDEARLRTGRTRR